MPYVDPEVRREKGREYMQRYDRSEKRAAAEYIARWQGPVV